MEVTSWYSRPLLSAGYPPVLSGRESIVSGLSRLWTFSRWLSPLRYEEAETTSGTVPPISDQSTGKSVVLKRVGVICSSASKYRSSGRRVPKTFVLHDGRRAAAETTLEASDRDVFG